MAACGRRVFLGRAAAGSAAALTGALVPLASVARAAPTAGSQKINLSFQPWQYAYGFQSLPASFNTLLWEATASFRSSHPSINLVFFGPTTNPYTSVLGGEGPDVPQLQGGGSGIPAWIDGDLLLDLEPNIRQSNINMADFDANQVADVTTPNGIFGIPNYTGTSGYVVNLSALDSLGVAYPPQDWTYLDWERLARSVSGKVSASQWRLGTTIDSGPYSNGPDDLYLHMWGSSFVDAADASKTGIGSPQAIAAGEFLYPMVWDNVAEFGWVPGNFTQGLTVLPFLWLQSYIIPAATQWRGFKWDFWPTPSGPAGTFAMTNPNYFAIIANTRYPAAAWELVEWLTIQPDWQRALMRTALLPPGYLPLWDEWIAIVRTVAPTLAEKNLDVFRTQVHRGIMYGGLNFAYQSPQAYAIIQKWFNLIYARKVSVADGFTQAAAQVTAFEGAAKSEAVTGSQYIAGAKAAIAAQGAELAAMPGLFPQGGRQP